MFDKSVWGHAPEIMDSREARLRANLDAATITRQPNRVHVESYSPTTKLEVYSIIGAFSDCLFLPQAFAVL